MATKVGGKVVDPVRKFRFEVYTPNAPWIPQGEVGFSEVSGLSGGSTAEDEYADGNDMTIRKLPGRTKYSDVTLKKGVDVGDHLANWRNATNETLADAESPFDTLPIPDINIPEGTRNEEFRAVVFVDLYDRSSATSATSGLSSPGKLLKRWKVFGAWPKDLQYDALNGSDGGVLYETVPLSVERVLLVFPAPRARNSR